MNSKSFESLDRMEDALRELLIEWQGGTIKIWGYTPTLSRMTIRLFKEGKGELYIICGQCRNIRGSFSWKDSSLRYTKFKDEDDETRISLRDSKSGFNLECGMISFSENEEPILN
jgi:hypothetical protein